MNEMNESKQADKLLQDAESQINTDSQMDKFHLQQKLSEEWMSLSCEERYAVGKELERKAANAEEHDVKAQFGFNDLTNELYALDFRKYVSSDILLGEYHKEVRINDPMKDCDNKNSKR